MDLTTCQRRTRTHCHAQEALGLFLHRHGHVTFQSLGKGGASLIRTSREHREACLGKPTRHLFASGRFLQEMRVGKEYWGLDALNEAFCAPPPQSLDLPQGL